jgi:hypothetical protein
MSKQLNLFPDNTLNISKSLQDMKLPDSETLFNPIDEMLAATARFRNRSDFLKLLHFIARFPNYSAFNCFLLYVQNPSATYVATARTWAQKFKRQPKQNARPLIILAPMAPILFLFDIQDTEGSPVPSSLLKPSEIRGQVLGRIYGNTLHNCTIQGISVHETHLHADSPDTAGRITPALRKKYNALNLRKDASYLILLGNAQSLEDKYSSLVYELGHIFCGHLGIDRHAWWPERKDLDIMKETLEAESVAFLVCRRIGLAEGSEKYLTKIMEKSQEKSFLSLNAVLQAVNYAEKTGKGPWQRPKKQSRY